MTNQAVVFNFISAFAISAGTSFGCVSIGGNPTKWQIVGCLIAGLVIAFKDTRSLLKLPPVDTQGTPPPAPQPPMIPLILGAVLMLALVFGSGCKTPHLEPGGAYAPTNAVGQVVVNDTALALADASYKFAYETTLGVMNYERDQRANIFKLDNRIGVQVKRALDQARPKVLQIDKRWALAREAYLKNPTPAGLTTVQTILAEIQQLLPVVQSQLAPVNELLLTP